VIRVYVSKILSAIHFVDSGEVREGVNAEHRWEDSHIVEFRFNV
jgi:hypothetical protein